MSPKIKFNEYIIEEDYIKIKLNCRNQIFWTIIDKKFLQNLINLKYRWYARYHKNINNYYAQCNIYKNGKHSVITLHQFILNYFGELDIDHVNNNSLDNRELNLRIIKRDNNTQNRKSKNSNNKSGYRNVCFIKGLWVVQLQVNGKNTRLGSFKNVDEAGKFAREMRKKYYGKFCGEN